MLINERNDTITRTMMTARSAASETGAARWNGREYVSVPHPNPEKAPDWVRTRAAVPAMQTRQYSPAFAAELERVKASAPVPAPTPAPAARAADTERDACVAFMAELDRRAALAPDNRAREDVRRAAQQSVEAEWRAFAAGVETEEADRQRDAAMTADQRLHAEVMANIEECERQERRAAVAFISTGVSR
jgi:hypothetical protein